MKESVSIPQIPPHPKNRLHSEINSPVLHDDYSLQLILQNIPEHTQHDLSAEHKKPAP